MHFRRNAIPLLVTLAVSTGCQGFTSASPSPVLACGSTKDLSGFVQDAQAATLTELSSDGSSRVGLVVRDSSMTLVSVCLPHRNGPAPLELVDGDRVVESVGGMFGGDDVTGTNLSIQYTLFPPTTGLKLLVRLKTQALAQADFASGPAPSTCPASSSTTVRWVTCGSLLVVDWYTGWHVAQPLNSLRGGVSDPGNGNQLLGFYVMETETTSDGARIRVGFDHPVGNRVSLSLTEAMSGTTAVKPPSPLTAELLIPASLRRAASPT
jgi:hypothetical protein